MLGALVMDGYIVYAWVVYATMLVVSFVVYLLGNDRQALRAARSFYPLLAVGVLMLFVTPTGYHL